MALRLGVRPGELRDGNLTADDSDQRRWKTHQISSFHGADTDNSLPLKFGFFETEQQGKLKRFYPQIAEIDAEKHHTEFRPFSFQYLRSFALSAVMKFPTATSFNFSFRQFRLSAFPLNRLC